MNTTTHTTEKFSTSLPGEMAKWVREQVEVGRTPPIVKLFSPGYGCYGITMNHAQTN